MSLPEVSQTVQDYGLVSIPSSASKTFAKVGVCSVGSPNVVRAWSGPNMAAMKTALGSGPLTENAAYHRQIAGGAVVTCPATPSAAGAAGTVTKVGTGTAVMTVTSTPLDSYSAIVEITRSAASLASGQGAFRYTLDGETYSGEISIPSNGVYAVTGAGISLNWAEGTFVDGDTYSFSTTAPAASVSDVAAAIDALLASPLTWGWLHVVGSPAPSASAVAAHPAVAETPPAVTLTGTASAFVDAIVTVVLGGTLGTMTFKVSTDNGATYGSTQTSSSSAPTYLVPGTGVTLNFASGTYVTAQFYTFNTYGSIGSLFAAVDAKMTAATSAFRYAGAILELPDTTDAILAKATASLSSTRVMYAGGYCTLASSVTSAGKALAKRSDAWPIAALRAKFRTEQDLGEVAMGSIPGVSALIRDEAATPALGASRIATLRTFVGMPGFYAASDTNGDMMAPTGSDYAYSQNRSVMDSACSALRPLLLPYLNKSLRVDKKTGKILEKEALAIEQKLNAGLEAVLISGSDGRHAESVRATVDRSEVILTTKNLTVDVAVLPLGVAKNVTATLHFISSMPLT